MKVPFPGLIALLLFTSCANDKTGSTTKDPVPPPVAIDSNYAPPTGVAESVSAGIGQVMISYLQLKNALAADNSKAAAQAGQSLLTSLNNTDTSNMTAGQKSEFSEIAESMREDAQHIADKSGDIDHQRGHFHGLSESAYEMAKIFGGGRSLFLTHCTMARDGEGASWLSEFQEIRNPYFGDQMLKCGEIKEQLK